MTSIILIVHDIRSAHNVGSLLRTADGLGVDKIYFTGYSPYPLGPHDTRLPHLAIKQDSAIHKTALGAEKAVDWKHEPEVFTVLSRLKQQGYILCALEQTNDAIKLPDWQPSKQCALILGSEVNGIAPDVLNACDTSLEIPMFGKKESFNVAAAAAMALYHIRFHSAS